MHIRLRVMDVLAVVAISGMACHVAQSSDDVKTQTAKITLYPAAEPKPALKYQLLPPISDRRPGNAAVWWNRVPADRTLFFANLFHTEPDRKGNWNDVANWMALPLGDSREKQYREKELPKIIDLRSSNPLFEDMDRAARFESCNWEQPLREGNYFAMLLPEIEQTRSFARLLSAKAHFEIAEGRYDEAVRTLQTGYAEAQHVAQSPTIVSWFQGVTIALIMSHQVQEAIQRPGAPNLYWAVSTLPRPLVDLRLSCEAESNILYLQFPELRDLDKKNLPADGWRDLLEKTQGDVARVGEYIAKWSRPEDASRMQTAKKAVSPEAIYPRAKEYLVDHGSTRAEVDAMPMAQAVLLYSVKAYKERSDEQYKWFFLPPTEASTPMSETAQTQSNPSDAAVGIFPAVFFFWRETLPTAKEAETRLEWIIASLRIFEAMRLYAAKHQGRWPEQLTDIVEVPIPLNPYDGKPFTFVRRGDTVVVTYSERGPKYDPQRYEITLEHNQPQPAAAKNP
jgi:hypothetical protein